MLHQRIGLVVRVRYMVKYGIRDKVNFSLSDEVSVRERIKVKDKLRFI